MILICKALFILFFYFKFRFVALTGGVFIEHVSGGHVDTYKYQ